MKVAIIGSGAAAVGALRALAEWGSDMKVTVLDIGDELIGPFETNQPPNTWSWEYYKQLYSHLRKEWGLKFPPPKNHFGSILSRHEVDGNKRVWESRLRGGLTNFWGASVLPFTDRELRLWPIKANELSPYYRMIAEIMGISGERDALNEYFPEDFVNRPPINMLPVQASLKEAVCETRQRGSYRLVAGVSRLALETRDDRTNRCLYSGECMVGCAVKAIYSAKQSIDQYQEAGLIDSYVKGKVVSIDPEKNAVRICSGESEESLATFDRIYVCAGCVGSTEIIMRSMGMKDGFTMSDNAVYTFPILYFGREDITKKSRDGYFALTNLVIGCIPDNSDDHFAMLQVYPSLDHLWRYFLPVTLWSAFQGLGQFLRRHILWGRLYVHSKYSQRYAITLNKDDALCLELERPAIPLCRVEGLMECIRKTINRDGFYIPNLPPLQQSTSSHYAASIPFGEGKIFVPSSGEVMPGVFLCDSTCFSDGPATSPTFTIMANSCRIVHHSL